MKPIEINFNSYDEDHRARFYKDIYEYYGNLYVGVTTWDEECKCWMPWGDLTVNLDMKCKPNEAFLDTNNCAPDIIRILKEKGYIKDTGITRQNGWCTYPLYEFTEEFLNGIECEGDDEDA